MALADITLVDSQATPQNHVHAYVATENNLVIRKNLSAPLDEPETLAIGSRDAKVNGEKVRSTLWKLTRGYLDADGVTTRFISCRVIWDVDPKIYTDARMEDVAAEVLSGLTEANVKAYVKGSVG